MAVQGWRWPQPSQQFLVVVLAGRGAPRALPLAPRVSAGEVTCSGVAEGCCVLPKWPTVCPYRGLLIRRLVVRSSLCDVLWVKKCFLTSSLNLWVAIRGCGPSCRLLLPGGAWPHPSPPSLPTPQLGAARPCPQPDPTWQTPHESRVRSHGVNLCR